MRTVPPTRRRWFQFSLGTMFFAMTVFAVLLGHEVRVVRKRDMMARRIAASGGIFPNAVSGNAIIKARAADPTYRVSRVGRMLGDSNAPVILFYRHVTPEDMERSSYFPEADVFMSAFELPTH